MDLLASEIETKKAEIAALKSRLHLLEIELAAFVRAAELRPASQPENPASLSYASKVLLDQSPVRRGGKPPGSISMDWRKVLGDIYAREFTFLDFSESASARGIGTSDSNLRDRLRYFIANGFVVENKMTGHFMVTPEAGERFGLIERIGASSLEEEEAP